MWPVCMLNYPDHTNFVKKINIIFFSKFCKKNAVILVLMFTEREWLWHCGTKFYYHVYPLLIFVNDEDDMINDEPLNWLWLFLFSLFYPLVRPGHGPSWLSRLVYLTCSAPWSLSLLSPHILFHVDLHHNWVTGPVQANFQTFNCFWSPDVWCD